MEHKLTVHIDGFEDPLLGIVNLEREADSKRLFGTVRPGMVRADGVRLIINHEEQQPKEESRGYEDPIFSYTVAFDDPLVGREKLMEWLKERFAEPRKATVGISEDGKTMKIG